MKDYIRAIADKLTIEKKPVVLYGAGSDAIFIILRLQNRFSVVPTCICDSDISRHHQNILGIEILSLDEALDNYFDASIYISSRSYKYEIIGEIFAHGKVLKERILNYEPVVYTKSCRYLENDVVVGNNSLNFCCSDFGKKKSLYVEFNGNYEQTIKNFVDLRDKLVSDLNNSVPTSCDGCPCVRLGYYAAERKIRLYNYAEGGICNYNCAYCTASAKDAKAVSEKDIDFQKMLLVLKSLALISEECTSDLSPGEITVHPKRNEIYTAIENRADIILTNASIYDERLAKILNTRGRLYISIDAGTRTTYAKIKGFDLFDQVRDNLRRYKDSVGFAPYELKYIFMPEVNDNNNDVDGFVEFCKNVGTNSVLISYDFYAPYPEEITTNAVKRLIDQLNSNGIFYKVISDVINRAIEIG